MIPWREANAVALSRVDFVLTDVDDTLTNNGRLEGRTLDALARLQNSGIRVVPVTAASAGWASLMARMWPVTAVIAENGGLSFVPAAGGMQRRYFDDGVGLQLPQLQAELMARLPELHLSFDAAYRETCITFQRLPSHDANRRVLSFLPKLGANGTVNSMWLLAWTGRWDKLAMSRRILETEFGIPGKEFAARVLYVDDSENDEVMFASLPLSVGVATIRHRDLEHWPTWITEGLGGAGFVEVASRLIKARSSL